MLVTAAPENTAAQVRIVSGLLAVASRPVRYAAPGVDDLELVLAADPHPERVAQRAYAEPDQHGRTGEAEGEPQRLDLQQHRRAERSPSTA